MKKIKAFGKSVWTLLLTITLMFSGLIMLPYGAKMVHAEENSEKTQANTKLGIGDIGYPRNNIDDNRYRSGFDGFGGKWNYVYFGKYDGNPVRYRVLDPNSSDYGVNGGSMLLDCDNVLKVMPFNRAFNKYDSAVAARTNKWENSEVKTWLNGNSFLNSESCFSSFERNAIAASAKAAMSQTDKVGWIDFQFQPLTGEKIFILDSNEVANNSYGYIADNGNTNNHHSQSRTKKNLEGRIIAWWLRSCYDGSSIDIYETALVGGDGADLNNDFWAGAIVADLPSASDSGYAYGSPVGVSPAMNVSLSSILFSTKVSEDEYKLTLKGESLSAAVTEGKQAVSVGQTLTIPYTVKGDANRLSILITYIDPQNGKESMRNYSVLKSGAFESTGIVSFSLSGNVQMGDKIYLIAEKINGVHETDYASFPTEISVKTPVVTFDANGGKIGTDSSVTQSTEINGQLSSLPTPERKNSTENVFMGWYTEPVEGEMVTRNTVFSSSQTVYAHWTELYYIDENESMKKLNNDSIHMIKSGGSIPTTWDTGWYCLQGTVYSYEVITIYGDVNLILCDDADFSFREIIINNGNSLNIYCQKDGTGSLDARCGIISSYDKDFGNITIYGGNITTQGDGVSAAIGGYYCGRGGCIVINGGTVRATGIKFGPGIGGGTGNSIISAGDCGEIIINGGTVVAQGGMYAPGIGGGSVDADDDNAGTPGAGGNIIINGGKVTAVGGKKFDYDIGPGGVFIDDNFDSLGADGKLTIGNLGPDDYIDSSKKISASISLKCPLHFENRSGEDIGAVTAKKLKSIKNKVVKVGKSTAVSIEGGDRSVTFEDQSVVIKGSVPTSGSGGVWSYQSGNINVAEIDNSGNVKINGVGQTEITAKYVSSLVDGEATMTLTVIKAASKTLTDHTISVNKINMKLMIETDQVIPAEAGRISGCTLGQAVCTGSFLVSNLSADENSVITAELAGGSSGDSITIPVQVTARNYDCSFNIVVTLQTYAVKVQNGRKDGYYAEGEIVTISANDAPDGKEFDKWTTTDGVTFADANSATTTFVMSAKAVTVTATYKNKESSKTDPFITKEPAAITGLVYDGTAKALITAGNITDGTLYYAVVDNTVTTVSADGLIYSTDIPTATNAGNYTVYYRISGSETVNGVEPTPINVSIERKAVTVKADDKTKEKGSADPLFTATITGLVEGEEESLIQFTLSREEGENAGSYEITPSGDEEQGNYTVTFKRGILTIEEKQTTDIEPTDTEPTDTQITDKRSQELGFAESEVTLKVGDAYTNTLSGAKTDVSYKSSDENIATVDETGRVTAIGVGTAEITATASETDEYYSASDSYVVNVEEEVNEEENRNNEEGKNNEQKEPDKVPLTDTGETYASSEDNFAAVASSGKINDQILDFSKVAGSSVDPSGLKMTAIGGSKFTTKMRLKDKGSVKVSGGVKVKVNKKTLIPKITCKKSGSVMLTFEDDSCYTVNFTVEKPKAQKSEKNMSKSDGQVTKSVSDLFGTHIDAGELSIIKQKFSQATVSDNKLIVNPAEKDSIKVRYKYLDKNYDISIKIK